MSKVRLFLFVFLFGTNLVSSVRAQGSSVLDCKDGDLETTKIFKNEFVIEVCRNGSYKRVCRDNWDHREASVACRQLNLGNAGISSSLIGFTTFALALFKPPRGIISDISCYGNETHLQSCRRQLQEGSCGKTATVVRCLDSDECVDGQRRIVRDHSSLKGRVEVCFNGLWGAAYSVSTWDTSQVSVICKGSEPSGAVALQPAPPIPGYPLSQVIWPVHIACNSSDTNATLDDCLIQLTNDDIPSPPQSSTIGFQCRRDFLRGNCTDGDVRISELVVRDNNNSGLVEVCKDNSWHKVCSSMFDNTAADIVCRQLGYQGTSSVDFNGGGPILPRTPPLPTFTLAGSCSGDEEHLLECVNQPLPLKRRDTEECPNMSFARVLCRDQPLLFLNSPGETILNQNSFIAEEGRYFELDCSSSSNVILRLEDPQGMEIGRGLRVASTTLRRVTPSHEGIYTCVVEPDNPSKEFSITVQRTEGDSSSSIFRMSLPPRVNSARAFQDINDIVLSAMSEKFEGVQEVRCYLVLGSMRQEDLEQLLNRVECVVLNYPPVNNTDVVANTAVEFLRTISIQFSFVTAPASEGFCNAETVNLEDGSVYWPETISGSEPVIQACPSGQNRTLIRRCISANWTEVDYNCCMSFNDILALNITEDNVASVLKLLNCVVKGTPEGQRNDSNARIIANILNTTAALIQSNERVQISTEEVVRDVVDILDTLLLEWDPEVVEGQGSENVENFEVILVSFITSENFTQLSIDEEDIALLAKSVMAEMLRENGLSFSSSSINGQLSITEADSIHDLAPEEIASVLIPTSIVEDLDGPLNVAVTVFEEPTFFPLSPPTENNTGLETRIGTPVVSVLVARDQEQRNLDPPLILNLAITDLEEENVVDARCVFWDFKNDEWSTEGCSTEFSQNSNQITCTCTNIGNFAALVDVCCRTEVNEGFCNAEIVHLEDGSVYWPLTKSGSEPVIRPCPSGQNRTLIRRCISANWTEVDYNCCMSFNDILALNITEDNVASVLKLLNCVVKGTPEGQRNDSNARIIANILNTIAALIQSDERVQISTEEVVRDVVDILDTLLLEWDPEVVEGQGSENVKNLEVILVNFITSDNFTELSIDEEEIALLARRVMDEVLREDGLSFSSSSNNGQPSITKADGLRDLAPDEIASVLIPTSIIEDLDGPLSVAVTVFEEPTFFPLPSPTENNTGLETRIGTPVVSVLVARDQEQLEFRNLDPPLVLNLAIMEENVVDARCVFWDFTNDEWSTEGCSTEFSQNSTQITCTCTHLTNFAALVDVCHRTEGCETSSDSEADSSEDDFALGIVSIVGVSLSLVGLIATIFTMLFFKVLRKRDATKFHVQLCISMFIMLLVFLVGINRTSVYGGCVTVSVLIHYFTLVSVMWMGAEAILIFLLGFSKITLKHIVIISLICWLAPLIPVIIPVAINPDYVIIESEGDNHGVCFIGNTVVFFVAFLAPILAIISFNFVVFIIVLGVLIHHRYRQKSSGNQTHKSKEAGSTIRLMISIIGIMSIFGLTWVFGALTVDKESLVFQIIFAILNLVQGVIIFLFFCVLGRDSCEFWVEIFSCGRYKSSHLHPSSATSSAATSGEKHKTDVEEEETTHM